MKRENRSHSRDEGGFLIVQVAMMAGALLFLIFIGFHSARRASQIANTGASSNEFKDLVLAVKQNLAEERTCANRLFGAVKPQLAPYIGTSNPLVLASMRGPGGPTSPLMLTTVDGQAATRNTPDFKITKFQIEKIVQHGRRNADLAPKGSQPSDFYRGNLVIVAERRHWENPNDTQQKVYSFLGSSEIRAEIPIAMEVENTSGTQQILSCSILSDHVAELGPALDQDRGGTSRKSGIECLDRGGAPVTWNDVALGQIYLVCALPKRSFFLNCDMINHSLIPGANLPNPEGWKCIASTAEVSYAY